MSSAAKQLQSAFQVRKLSLILKQKEDNCNYGIVHVKRSPQAVTSMIKRFLEEYDK